MLLNTAISPSGQMSSGPSLGKKRTTPSRRPLQEPRDRLRHESKWCLSHFCVCTSTNGALSISKLKFCSVFITIVFKFVAVSLDSINVVKQEFHTCQTSLTNNRKLIGRVLDCFSSLWMYILNFMFFVIILLTSINVCSNEDVALSTLSRSIPDFQPEGSCTLSSTDHWPDLNQVSVAHVDVAECRSNWNLVRILQTLLDKNLVSSLAACPFELDTELLFCDFVVDVVGIFSDPLDRHLLSEDYTVVAFSQPLFSWPPQPVRITTIVSFVVVGLPSESFNSHHLRVAERHHSLRAAFNR